MNIMLIVALLTALFGGVVVWLGLGIRGVTASNFVVAVGMGVIICSLVFTAGLT
jgi:hypothetical protein